MVCDHGLSGWRKWGGSLGSYADVGVRWDRGCKVEGVRTRWIDHGRFLSEPEDMEIGSGLITAALTHSGTGGWDGVARSTWKIAWMNASVKRR